MQNLSIAFVFVIAVASFLLGRGSVRILRDKYLESKRNELMAIRDSLEERVVDLRRRENALRIKWQAMVVNASEIESLINGDEDAWTPADDRFLESWSSAERVSSMKE